MSRKIYPNLNVYAIYSTKHGIEQPCNFPGVLVDSPYTNLDAAKNKLYWVSGLSDPTLKIKKLKWGEYQQDLIEHDTMQSWFKDLLKDLNRSSVDF